jgi:trk system potassium uptake protein TrkH
MAFYWRALRGESLRPQLAEVRAYLLLLVVVTAAVTTSVVVAGDIENVGEALRASGFSVVSLMTTTALVTEDFDTFNDFARVLIVGVAFIGACSGSTSGGMKVIRVLLLARTSVQEVQRQLQPRAVQVLRLPGRVFSEEIRRTVLGFFFLYICVWATGALALMAFGVDPVTAGSAASAGVNLSGVGLQEIGASENFGAIPTGGRAVLTFLMLVGRLEIFTVIALLTPAFWRRQWA